MRLLAVVGGLLAAGLAALPPADAATRPDAIVEATKTIPPIEFLVARGGPNACGLGCDSWIAAEGLIDDGAATRLRRVLDKLGARKLPVFFYSPGGDTAESLAIGRLLRQRGLAAGIAVTVPVDCVPAHEVEACSKLMRQPQPPKAALLMDGTACNSACAYAILGAVRREIAPTAQLGVHSGHSYLSVAGAEVTQRERARTIERGQRRIARDVQRYLADMGIDRGLFEIASATKFESMHVLTRAELFDLGIDRREVANSGWHFSDLPGSSLGSSVLTTLVEKENSEAGAFRQMALAISCGDPAGAIYTVSSIALLPGPSPRPSTDDIRIGNGANEIWLAANGSRQRTANDKVYEVREAKAPRAAVESLLLAAPTISFIERQRAGTGPRSDDHAAARIEHPLSSPGIESSLKMLAGRCAQDKAQDR